MEKFLIREGQDRVRIPLDPIQGIYLSQGSLIQHVIFAAVLMIIFIVEERISYGDDEFAVIQPKVLVELAQDPSD